MTVPPQQSRPTCSGSPHATRGATRVEAREGPVGAYGLRLAGVEEIAELFVPAPADWVPLELVCRTGEPTETHERLEARRAVLRSSNGAAIEVDLEQARVVFTAPWGPTLDEVVHPYLASVASVVAYWRNEESLHAGAFVTAEGAWGVVGEHEAGKSAILAALADRGLPVLTDDLLVLRRETALAGPRTLDLREDVAQALGVGASIGVVGTRERWRVTVGPVDAEVPLRGWVFLEWADRREIARLSSAEGLGRLVPQRGIRVPPGDPSALLELARLPSVVFRRPHDLDGLSEDLDRLLEAIG